MPLNLPDKLPAIELLKEENIFVIDNSRANAQDIRPLKIVILNLMPLKITTETDLVRLLSNTPLQPHQPIEVCLVTIHAENAFCHYNHLFIFGMMRRQQLFQLFIIIMPVTDALCT